MPEKSDFLPYLEYLPRSDSKDLTIKTIIIVMGRALEATNFSRDWFPTRFFFLKKKPPGPKTNERYSIITP